MRTFFGLTNDYIESVYEEIFNLKMHGNWSFMEAYNLPVQIRRWFLRRIAKYYEDKTERQRRAIKNT